MKITYNNYVSYQCFQTFHKILHRFRFSNNIFIFEKSPNKLTEIKSNQNEHFTPVKLKSLTNAHKNETELKLRLYAQTMHTQNLNGNTEKMTIILVSPLWMNISLHIDVVNEISRRTSRWSTKAIIPIAKNYKKLSIKLQSRSWLWKSLLLSTQREAFDVRVSEKRVCRMLIFIVVKTTWLKIYHWRVFLVWHLNGRMFCDAFAIAHVASFARICSSIFRNGNLYMW